MDCYEEVVIADSVVVFRSSPDAPLGDIQDSNTNYAQLLIRPPVRLGVRP